MGDEYTVLSEFALESGGTETTRIYKSFEGVRTAAADYEQGLLSAGRIVRSIGPGAEPYSVGQLQIEEYNDERSYSALKQSYRFRGRKRYIKCGTIANGLAATRQLFVGSVEDWTIDSGGRVRFTHKDAAIDRFKKPLRDTMGTVSVAVFPNLPPGQRERLIPHIYGDISTNGGNLAGAGPCPCFLIDENAAGKWRYVVAGHVCKEVTTVFKYGIVMASGFTLTTVNYGGRLMQVIDFNLDPRDPSRPDELEITVLAKGITTDGTAAGTLIENPVEQVRHFLTNYAGWDAAELDTGLFAAASSAADANQLFTLPAPYKTGVCIVDDGIDRRVLDILNEYTRSALLYVWMTTAGKVGVFLLTATEATNPAAPAFYVSEREILRGTFRVMGNRDVYSSISYQRVYNWTLDQYSTGASGSFAVPVMRAFPLAHTDRVFPKPHTSRTFPVPFDAGATGDLNLGDADTPDAPARLVSLQYVADEDTAVSVATVHGMLADERVQFVEFELPAEYLLNPAADLNRYVAVTHRQGIGISGYHDTVFRIVRTEASIMPRAKGLRCTAIRIAA